MRFPTRGIVEGFYGRLWTWAERGRVAEIAAGAGFDSYVYAPKEDRYQNADWRTPYPVDEGEALRDFVDRCRSVGLAPWVGMRPVGISYADDIDVVRLVEKLKAALALGADRLFLLADDIPSTLDAGTRGSFELLVDAHLWLVEEILRRLDLPPERLVFVPTEYHGPGGAYLARLGERLPAAVDVCWTGSDVFAPTIGVDEAEHIGRVLRRPPLIWDNYPVNDEPDRRDLRIGPIRGRDPGLARVTRGVLVNPALEPEATLVPLLTWAEFLADPDGYDPDGAWRRALLQVAGNERDAATVATIAAAFDRSIIEQAWERPPERAVAAARGALDGLANRALATDLAPFLEASAPR